MDETPSMPKVVVDAEKRRRVVHIIFDFPFLGRTRPKKKKVQGHLLLPRDCFQQSVHPLHVWKATRVVLHSVQ